MELRNFDIKMWHETREIDLMFHVQINQQEIESIDKGDRIEVKKEMLGGVVRITYEKE